MEKLDIVLKLQFSRRKFARIICNTDIEQCKNSFYGKAKVDGTPYGLSYSLGEDCFYFISKDWEKVKLSKAHVDLLSPRLTAAMKLVAEDGIERDTPTFW